MKIKITSESTVDLTEELIQKFDISTIPLGVTLGENSYLDSVNVTPTDIYDYVAKTGKLPHTNARSTVDYQEFWNGILKQGYDKIIHISISAKVSGSYNVATLASQDMPQVTVINSNALSTGTALLVLDACEQAKEGMAYDDIIARVQTRSKDIQTSFIIDKLDYLHKGGRCNLATLLTATLLKVKPIITMVDGELGVASKCVGKFSFNGVLKKYIDYVMTKFTNPDYTRCFITHTEMDQEAVKAVIDYVKSKYPFKEVLETMAHCTITCHCGKSTLGLLFINDGGVNQ